MAACTAHSTLCVCVLGGVSWLCGAVTHTPHTVQNAGRGVVVVVWCDEKEERKKGEKSVSSILIGGEKEPYQF